jgi:hypothetical protein
MANAELLEFSVLTFTADQLEIKVKNTSGAALNKTLTIELYPPVFLVSKQVNDAAISAAQNLEPVGVTSLDKIVIGPRGWSIWAKREASDSSVVILLFNGVDQRTGAELETPVAVAAGAEFTIQIPINPKANKADIKFPYRYQHDKYEADVPPNGTLELKPADAGEWAPDVTLTTDQKIPTAVTSGKSAKIFWEIKDGVSATLRGPLPGGNTELTLKEDPNEKYKLSKGSLEIRVVSSMTYVLQAEVKRPNSETNLQVVRMLSFDTANDKYLHLKLTPDMVLPYGLIEAHWAAWGVDQVQLRVGGETSRVINLTQQTLGRFHEGSGVMRFTARQVKEETVYLLSPPQPKKSDVVEVVRWNRLEKSEVKGSLLGLAVVAPKIALLTFEGLHIADVGSFDTSPALRKLKFVRKTDGNIPIAIAAVNKRFVTLRRTSPDLEVAPFKPDGTPDLIPPLNLPADIRNLVAHSKTVFDLVGFGGRAYIVVETPLPNGTVRRAFSVGFDSSTNKAEYRPELLLEQLPGYRLLTFDDALYALNRSSGQMLRFELTKTGTLSQPFKAASAVTKPKGVGQQERSMIEDGLLVPVGRVLVVLSPSAVPSLESLEKFGLHNVLSYLTPSVEVSTDSDLPKDPDLAPQDLVYNPQKNYWARCGHDLDIKKDAVAAFRGGDSPRLWVIQPDFETYTLAVGSESLFAHDYVLDFPTKPLSPYLNKERQFLIKSLGTRILPMSDTYRKLGIQDDVGLTKVTSPSPNHALDFPVGLKYNDIDPTPITVRFLSRRDVNSRPDQDYMLELTFSGPNLSSASSVFRRLAIDGLGRLSNDEVFGSRKVHSIADLIEVPRPRQFDEPIKFVIVNTSKFRLKPENLDFGPGLISSNTDHAIALKHTYRDFTLKVDPRDDPDSGEIIVNLNFALDPGIESSASSQPQTKLIRLTTDKAKSIHVWKVKMLQPGEEPFKVAQNVVISSLADRPVYVCQIGLRP